MRASRFVAAALLLVAAGCRPGHRAEPETAATTTRPATGPSPATVPPPTEPVPAEGTSGPDIVTLLASNVRLFDADDADNGFRVLVDSAAGAVSVVLSGVPTPNRTVFVCPAAELDRRAPRATCTNPANGVPARLPFGPTSKGIEVVQLGTTGTGPAANTTSLTGIALTFTPLSREVRLRLPPLRGGPTGEASTFRLSPPGTTGEYRATATWASPAGTGGKTMLWLLGGGTGSALSEGGPGVTLAGTLPAPGDASFRLRNTGTATLNGVTVTALFP